MARIFRLIFRGTARRLVADAMAQGIRVGYDLGWQLGRTEHRNKGIILSCQIESQVEEILKSAGF